MGWWRNVKCKTEALNLQEQYGDRRINGLTEKVILLGNKIDWEIEGHYENSTTVVIALNLLLAETKPEIIYALHTFSDCLRSGYLPRTFYGDTLLPTYIHALVERCDEKEYGHIFTEFLGAGGW